MFRLPWRKHSDEEYIEDVRRWVGFWIRFRTWLLLMNFCLLGGFVWLAFNGVHLVLAIVQPGNIRLPWLGFAAGAAVGFMLGWIFVHVIHGIIFGLGGFRSERLLLQYYDAAVQCPTCTERLRDEYGEVRRGSTSQHEDAGNVN